MACLTIWRLRQDDSDDATRLRVVLVRLSGRQMKWGLSDTAPALLRAWKCSWQRWICWRHTDLSDILALARRVLPRSSAADSKSPYREDVILPMRSKVR